MEKGKIIEAKNIAYFQALANSRASLTQLGIALVAGLPTGLLLTWLLKQASVYAHIVEFKGGVYVFAFLTVFMGLIGVSSFFTKTVYLTSNDHVHLDILTAYSKITDAGKTNGGEHSKDLDFQRIRKHSTLLTFCSVS